MTDIFLYSIRIKVGKVWEVWTGNWESEEWDEENVLTKIRAHRKRCFPKRKYKDTEFGIFKKKKERYSPMEYLSKC